MTETVRLTIDGTTVAVPKGTLVIEAARRVGVMIPHFCYHPKLKPDANCRMCLVEVEKMPKLQTACSTPVAEGMSVRTATTVVDDAHKSVLEFILANHPLDCPVCDQGGKCDLQDFSHQYTPTTSRFTETKRIFQKEYFSPLIETQMNRCVQCLRCVRYCDEVMDVKALAPVGRGTMTEIKHFAAHQLDCEFCGGCVQSVRSGHHEPAVHVRISPLDAQAGRNHLYLLRRRLPDHRANQGQRTHRGQLARMERAGTMAIFAHAAFSASMSPPTPTVSCTL